MTNRKYDKSTLDNLLYRRQFVLGPHYIEQFKNWRKIKVADTMCLTVHPDLEVCKTNYKNKSITVLGYILDPKEPQATNSDIISSLIAKLHNSETVFKHTNDYGGRWILIVNDGDNVLLFNDPVGLRQVFYTENSYSSYLWCASQPGIIAEQLNLEMDTEAMNFMCYHENNGNEEYWWPGDTSLYKEIKHLLPNHYLCLKGEGVHRFWPDTQLSHLSLEEGVDRTSNMLKALMKSASNRFSLALAITAGWDSRLVLAASKEISRKIYYFTILRRGLDRDFIIPNKLLPKLGLEHSIIEYPKTMVDEFKYIYSKNVVTAHELYGKMAQGLYSYYPQDRVCAKGNASEIARESYRPEMEHVNSQLPESDRENVTSWKLANITKMGSSSFVIEAFDEWLTDAKDTHSIDLLDLFYWEQRMGNWQAMAQLEWDIVQEVFTPFNCRRLLTDMLSVDKEYRDRPEFRLYKEVINNLWPEVLCEPINPQIKAKMTKLKSIKHAIKNILIETHLLQFVPKEIKNIGRNKNPF